MAKPNNAEARMMVDGDYYGKGIEKLSLLRYAKKEELSWEYYDRTEERLIMMDGEIVSIHKY